MTDTEATSIVGAKLRSARESKKITVEEASSTTKIHRNIIEDLEADTLSRRLNDVYVRSFLRRYSSFLGLDPDQMLHEYFSVHASAKQEPKLHIGIQRLTSKWQDRLKLPGKIAIIIVAGITFSYYLYFFGVKSVREHLHHWRSTRQPARMVRKQEPLRDRRVSPQKVSRTKDAVPQTQEGAPPKSSPFPIPQDQPIILSIAARHDCWMQIKADSQVVFQGILSEGISEKWQAVDGFELWIGNIGGISATVNGYDLPEFGKPGRVVKGLKITRQGVQR
ncbi:MAG: DUF4115 domain-containing protein [Candidatus Omnitrophica bacterium]|nr:DUF4115 domain-containing protein [Candidatus Omnitrophota bacterium]